jgi:hypothetical protein
MIFSVWKVWFFIVFGSEDQSRKKSSWISRGDVNLDWMIRISDCELIDMCQDHMYSWKQLKLFFSNSLIIFRHRSSYPIVQIKHYHILIIHQLNLIFFLYLVLSIDTISINSAFFWGYLFSPRNEILGVITSSIRR